nr:U3 snoRNP-associated protein-like YAOH [Ipomoea batatas]
MDSEQINLVERTRPNLDPRPCLELCTLEVPRQMHLGASSQKKKRFSDPFFESEGGDNKRRRKFAGDDEIESSDDDKEYLSGGEGGAEEDEEDNEVEETAAEKKKRLADAYLEKIRAIASRDEEDTQISDYNCLTDIVVSKMLMTFMWSCRIQTPEPGEGFRVLLKHRQAVTAVALSEDDLKGFSASKDGTIVSWDVESGKKEKYSWPSDEVLKSHGAKDPQGRASKHSKHVLALAISSDGRISDTRTWKKGFEFYLKHRQALLPVGSIEDDLKGSLHPRIGHYKLSWDVESGKKRSISCLVRHFLIVSWSKGSTRFFELKHSKTCNLALANHSDAGIWQVGQWIRHVPFMGMFDYREHIQTFPGHKGPVSCLTFRQGSSELFSGSFDRSVKIWNVEDRAYVNTLFGHQAEVLTIDSLRKERVLTVGRDRTMHLFKVPEESQFIFRASASSLECCCFINNDEFLSGSSDGSIEHWTAKKKKPIHIVKNAHTSLIEQRSTGMLSNGDIVQWLSVEAVIFAASGAGNGLIRLWKVEGESKGICPLFEIPLAGFVNSLAFAKSGRFLVAGVGKVKCYHFPA